MRLLYLLLSVTPIQSFDLAIGHSFLIKDSKSLPLFAPDYSIAYTCHPVPGIYESSQIQARTLNFYSNSQANLEITIEPQQNFLVLDFNPKSLYFSNETTVNLKYNCIGTGWAVVTLTIFDGERDFQGHWKKFCGEKQGFDLSLIVLLGLAVGVVYFSAYRAKFVAPWEPSIEDQANVLTTHHAYGFIFGASGMLTLLFFFKDYLKYLLQVLISSSGWFAIILSLNELLQSIPTGSITLPILGKQKKTLLLSATISSLILLFYTFSKNWILNNTIGIFFSYVSIKTIKIDSYKVGALLLGLVLVYDIVWVYFSQYVFGENVMVAVATGIDLPIKLQCPHLTFGSYPFSCSMLGLGDIVLPGIFLAFASRFDQIHNSNYLKVLIFCYVFALVVCVGMLVVYSHAQPAMLFISPMLMGGMLGNAYLRKEVKEIVEGIQVKPLVSSSEVELNELD